MTARSLDSTDIKQRYWWQIATSCCISVSLHLGDRIFFMPASRATYGWPSSPDNNSFGGDVYGKDDEFPKP